jgi:hypothetical protein
MASTALFVINAVVEIIPTSINFVKPDWNFPGLNGAGVLAACWWNAAGLILGFFSVAVLALEVNDGDVAKSIVALGTMLYHMSILVQTTIRLVRDQQVDGMDTSCCNAACARINCGSRSLQSCRNIQKGLLGIAIHAGLMAWFTVFLSMYGSGANLLILAVVSSLYVFALSVISAICNLAAAGSRVLSSSNPPVVMPPLVSDSVIA